MGFLRRGALGLAALGALLVGSCAGGGGDPGDARVSMAMRASFDARGQAGLERLEQDETQRLCSAAEAAGRSLSAEAAEQIQADNARLIRWPAQPGTGDWRRGEQIAQSGVGRQFSDPPGQPAGGNCYACHRLSTDELAYGTLGPSLLGYARLRTGMSRADLERYTYGKIYNAQAYSACTVMPRFGARGILTEAQIRDLVALLLDPGSPVNR